MCDEDDIEINAKKAVIYRRFIYKISEVHDETVEKNEDRKFKFI